MIVALVMSEEIRFSSSLPKETAIMKDQPSGNQERKQHEESSLHSSAPSSQKEMSNRKEGQRKERPGKNANTAKQGK